MKIKWENYREEREKLFQNDTIYPSSFMEFGAENLDRAEYETEIETKSGGAYIYPDDLVKTAEKTKSGFPKILWRTFKNTNLSEKWKEGFESGFLLKGWTVVFMTDEDNLDFVKRHYPSLLTLYEGFEYNIQRVDLVRILYLHKFGGLYSDLDKVFLTDFSYFFEENNSEVYLVRSPNNKAYITNSFMASRPKAKLWIELINAISAKDLPIWAWGRHLKVMYSTGPGILTKIVRDTDTVYANLPGVYFESCSVCDYPCKASIETGQYVKQIEGSSWVTFDTKAYLCVLCSWPQILFAIIVILVFILFHFFG